MLLPSTSLGEVERGELLARGGTADIFLGAAADGREVVIKLYRADRAELGAHEAAAYALVGHLPWVPRMYGHGPAGAGYAIVMSRARGQRLPAVAPWPWARARESIRSMLYALKDLHACGVIHGDLNPGNILVLESGRSTLLDLGATSFMAATGAFVGTPGYVAPEVVVGEVPTGPSDVYGLGMCIYFLLHGKQPFTDAAVDGDALHRALIGTELTFAPGLPEALISTLQAMTQRDPEARCPLEMALEAISRARPPGPPPALTSGRVAASQPRDTPRAVGAAPAPRRPPPAREPSARTVAPDDSATDGPSETLLIHAPRTASAPATVAGQSHTPPGAAPPGGGWRRLLASLWHPRPDPPVPKTPTPDPVEIDTTPEDEPPAFTPAAQRRPSSEVEEFLRESTDGQGVIAILVARGGVLELWTRGQPQVKRWKLPGNPRLALVDLLVELFGDFRQLTAHLPAWMRKRLPPGDLPLIHGADLTVAFLVRYGEIDDDFFESLTKEFPRRELEVRAVQAIWSPVAPVPGPRVIVAASDEIVASDEQLDAGATGQFVRRVIRDEIAADDERPDDAEDTSPEEHRDIEDPAPGPPDSDEPRSSAPEVVENADADDDSSEPPLMFGVEPGAAEDRSVVVVAAETPTTDVFGRPQRDRLAIASHVAALPTAEFDRLLAALKVPIYMIPPALVPAISRAEAVLDHVERREGDLAVLVALLEGRGAAIVRHPFKRLATDPTSLLGEVVSGHHLLRVLGRGGSGVVYEAKLGSTGAIFAVKLLYSLPHAASHVVAETWSMIHGLQAARHPAIVPIHEFGEAVLESGPAAGTRADAGMPLFMRMELVVGLPFDAWASRRTEFPDGLAAVLRALAAIADCLHTCHETQFITPAGISRKGVYHGDLKPANILMRADDSPAILDFLVIDAQRLLHAERGPGAAAGDFSMATLAFGTPGYMPPEQERRGELGASSDIYALGVTATRTLLGPRGPRRRPGGVPSLWLEHHGAHAAVTRLIDGMTADEASARPRSMAVVRDELRRCADRVARGGG